MTPVEPLSTSILAIMYFGDVVFAISGALTAARYRMDVLGFVMIGTITGIGGGDHTGPAARPHRLVDPRADRADAVQCWSPGYLFFIRSDISRRKVMVWSDALGLSVFGVVGCHIGLQFGSPRCLWAW